MKTNLQQRKTSKSVASRSASKGRKIKGIFLRGKVFWLSCIQNGHRIQTSLHTDDEAEAVRKAIEIRGNPVLAVSEPLRAEVKAFVAHKLEKNEYSKSSAASKQHCLLHFADFVNKWNPDDITTADAQRFYDSYKGKVVDSTREGYAMTLKSFFNYLLDVNKVRQNPAVAMKLARVDRKGRTVFATRELRDKLVTEAPDDDLRFILFCGFHAGMRKDEIVEARPDWFDVNRGAVEIKTTPTFRPKDRDARTIPLTSSFKEFLNGYGLRSPFMLRADVEHGAARYRYDFRRPYEKFMEAQGCSWLTAHIMRHTFASLLAISGVSIFKIALWLGDDVRVVQNHYAKLLPQDVDIERMI
jgi:integrase